MANYKFKKVDRVRRQLLTAGFRSPEDLAKAFDNNEVTLETIQARLRPDDTGGQLQKIVAILSKICVTDSDLSDWYEPVVAWSMDDKDVPPANMNAGEQNNPGVQTVVTIHADIPSLEYGCLGRDVELEKICEAMTGPSPKPVLIYGGPGIGKTTLKRAALVHPEMKRHFRERRYWVKADRTHDADSLVRAIGEAVGHPPFDPNPTVARRTLLGHLRDLHAPIALGLDNIETPLGLAAQPEGVPDPNPKTEAETKELIQDLGEIQHVAILASFRGETKVRAGTFWNGVPVGSLADEPAVELFLGVADKLKSTPSGDSVRALVREVDAVPLAVVLLASYAELAGSLEELEKQWRMRRTGIMEHGEGRRESWKEALGFSLKSPLLMRSPLASRLVRLMGQLPDGVKKSEVAMFLSTDDVNAAQAGDLLLSLGLIQNNNGGTRWRMLHPIREFLCDNKNYLPDATDWKIATKHFLTMLTREEEKIDSEESSIAINKLKTEFQNIVFSLIYELDNSISIDNSNFILSYSNLLFSINTIQSNIEPLVKATNLEKSVNNLLSIGIAFEGLGDLNLCQANYSYSRSCYINCYKIFHKTRNYTHLAKCIRRLGEIHLRKSEFSLALKKFNLSLKKLNPLSDSEQAEIRAGCIRSIGNIYFNWGDFESALFHYNESLSIVQKSNNRLCQGHCHMEIGDIYLMNKEFTKAKTHYTNSINLFIAIENRPSQINCIERFGLIEWHAGNIDEALEILEKNHEEWLKLDLSDEIAWSHYLLSFLSPKSDFHRERAILTWEKIFTQDQIQNRMKRVERYVPLICL